jgi:hypothetical protein
MSCNTASTACHPPLIISHGNGTRSELKRLSCKIWKTVTAVANQFTNSGKGIIFTLIKTDCVVGFVNGLHVTVVSIPESVMGRLSFYMCVACEFNSLTRPYPHISIIVCSTTEDSDQWLSALCIDRRRSSASVWKPLLILWSVFLHRRTQVIGLYNVHVDLHVAIRSTTFSVNDFSLSFPAE